MKAYVHQGIYYAPGKQPKGAEKIDIPTDSHGLVAWVNAVAMAPTDVTWEGERFEPIKTPLMEYIDRHGAPGAPQEPQDCVQPLPATQVAQDPQIASREAVEAAWDTYPLAFRLHLGSLALEDARKELK